MSSYGTAIVIDVAPDGDNAVVHEALRDEDAFVSTDPVTGWARLTLYTTDTEQVDRVVELLRAAGHGRAAVAEDYDEFGALWVVLAATTSEVRTVHRRYVLNANLRNPLAVRRAVRSLDGIDPRQEDVAGTDAAAEAAATFDMDPAAMLTAESQARKAYRQLGLIGGPFPWWDALGLPWPGPEAGEPLTDVLAPRKASNIRLGTKAFRDWLEAEVAPHLPSPNDEPWVVTRSALYVVDEWFVRGVLFYPSSFDETMYVDAWVFPLYIGVSADALSYNTRLDYVPLPRRGDGAGVAAEVRSLWEEKDALGFLRRRGTLDGLLEKLMDGRADAHPVPDSLPGAEEIAYTELLLGNGGAAHEELLAVVNTPLSLKPAWFAENQERCRRVLDALVQEGREGAVAVLRGLREEALATIRR